MEWNGRTLILKNGEHCHIASARPEEADLLLHHLQMTSEETNYMIRYPEEITLTLEEEKAYIANRLENQRGLLLTAYVEEKLVAMAGVNPIGELEKVYHRGSFGISIRRSHWGLGIGTAVLVQVIAAARKMGYLQLELEVAAENRRAVALYEKCGFHLYGSRPAGFRLRDGSEMEEHLMVLRLK